MITEREKMVWKRYREFRKKKMISIDEFELMMYEIEKLLTSFRSKVDRIEKLKKENKELKMELKLK